MLLFSELSNRPVKAYLDGASHLGLDDPLTAQGIFVVAGPPRDRMTPGGWNDLRRVLRETFNVHASRMFIRTLRFNKKSTVVAVKCFWMYLEIKSPWFKGAASSLLIRRTKRSHYDRFHSNKCLEKSHRCLQAAGIKSQGSKTHLFINSETLSACQSIHIFSFAKRTHTNFLLTFDVLVEPVFGRFVLPAQIALPPIKKDK